MTFQITILNQQNGKEKKYTFNDSLHTKESTKEFFQKIAASVTRIAAATRSKKPVKKSKKGAKK